MYVAGNEVGDHLHAESARGARRLVDIGARNQRGGRRGISSFEGTAGRSDHYTLLGVRKRKRNVQYAVCRRRDGEHFSKFRKSRSRHREPVYADRDLGYLESSDGRSNRAQSECGFGSYDRDLCVGNGSMLRVVNDAMNGGEYGSPRENG